MYVFPFRNHDFTRGTGECYRSQTSPRCQYICTLQSTRTTCVHHTLFAQWFWDVVGGGGGGGVVVALKRRRESEFCGLRSAVVNYYMHTADDVTTPEPYKKSISQRFFCVAT